MKKITFLLIFILIFGFTGCEGTKNDSTLTENEWEFYNECAEKFVKFMANGDFASAEVMFDSAMKKLVPKSVLQKDIWDVITAKAGAFVDIHAIENITVDGYYICFVTSRHELIGVKLRVVFSKDGLIAGLFTEDYPMIAEESREGAQRDGFTDFPVIIGEETDFPLNGILSMPNNITEKMPAVVLVHGSGSHNMDEAIYANKPFRDIADFLAANGIAVIRYDKRGFVYGTELIQKFGGSFTVYEETIEDAVLAAEVLKSNAYIDENKIFIIGHSLGGMLAPRIHAEGGNFAGIISLAGSPRFLLDISYDQQMVEIDKITDSEEKESQLLLIENYDEEVQALLNLSDEEAKKTPVANGTSAYYFKDMYRHPVSEYTKNITVPFLIMQGSEDFQVYSDKDYILWQELLEGRSNATFKLYDGLNHLFMTSTTGDIEEYKIPGNVENQVLSDMAEWIKVN